MEELKKKAIETLIDKSEEIKIPLLPKNWVEKLLQKVGLKKKEIVFKLGKMLNGNRLRISPKLFDFPEFKQDDSYIYKQVAKLAIDHQDNLNYIVAVALQNDRNEPSKELLEAVKWLNDEQFAIILEKSIGTIDVENFLKSIIIAGGVAKLVRAENQ